MKLESNNKVVDFHNLLENNCNKKKLIESLTPRPQQFSINSSEKKN